MTTLVVVADILAAGSAVAQNPLSVEAWVGRAIPQGEFGESYAPGSTFGVELGMNFGPLIGLTASVGQSSVACDHSECSPDVGADLQSIAVGFVVSPFYSSPVRPFVGGGFAMSHFAQSGLGFDGSSMGFETSDRDRGARVTGGLEWVAHPKLAVEFVGNLQFFSNHRPGPHREQVGPPFGSVKKIYTGTEYIFGRDFEGRILTLDIRLKFNPAIAP